MGLLEIIVKTGIADAIASQLAGMKGNPGAIAETIENNVRRKIIKEQLSDPAYYDSMSALLDELIEARRDKAIEYEEYLKRIAALTNKVEAGVADDTPDELKSSPALRALFNNLNREGRDSTQADWVAEPEAEYGGPGHTTLQIALKNSISFNSKPTSRPSAFTPTPGRKSPPPVSLQVPTSGTQLAVSTANSASRT